MTGGALGVTAAVLVLAGPVSAQIVVGRSIDGVALGDTRAQVLSRLGPPQVGKAPPPGLGAPGATEPPSSNYFERLRGFVLFDASGYVNSISTESVGQVTSKGIHTFDGTSYGTHGSSLRAVRRTYPAIKCHGERRAPVCVLTSRVAHRTVYTAFVFDEGLGVATIEIAYRLLVHY